MYTDYTWLLELFLQINIKISSEKAIFFWRKKMIIARILHDIIAWRFEHFIAFIFSCLKFECVIIAKASENFT